MVEVFKDYIPNDKERVYELLPRYQNEFESLGSGIDKHNTELFGKDVKELEELWDFLDGNGFIIEHTQPTFPFDNHPIKIIIDYKGAGYYEKK